MTDGESVSAGACGPASGPASPPSSQSAASSCARSTTVRLSGRSGNHEHEPQPERAIETTHDQARNRRIGSGCYTKDRRRRSRGTGPRKRAGITGAQCRAIASPGRAHVRAHGRGGERGGHCQRVVSLRYSLLPSAGVLASEVLASEVLLASGLASDALASTDPLASVGAVASPASDSGSASDASSDPASSGNTPESA